MVSRSIKIREVVDESHIGGLGGKGQRARYRIGLIEINDAGNLHSMVANLSDIEAELGRESMLNAHRAVHHIRSAEIANHGESVATTRIATEPDSALTSSGYAREINLCRLV